MSQLLKVLGVRDRRSFANISSTPLAIRTNVLGSSLGTAGNGGIINIPNRTLANYLTTMNDCKCYECFDLIQNIMKLLTDYVQNQLDLQTKEYIEIADDPVLSAKVIRLINETDYNNKFIKDIHDIIYYGGKGYNIRIFEKPTGGRRLTLVDLIEPYIIVKVFDRQKMYEHYDRFINDRVIEKYNVFQARTSVEVKDRDILFIGDQNFKLIDARTSQENNVLKGNKDEELLIDTYSLYASKPLLYSVMQDIKNYIVYKTLSSVLAVKDVLIPTFMRLGLDLTKATTTDKINETVNELEAKINEAVDTTLVMGQTLQIDQLINAVFSSVRILPDPGNLLSSIDQLNLDPLKEKLEQINSKTEDTKNSIFDSLGIPSDLFDGGSNQYEVVTRNQRYQATVGSILAMLKKIYKDNIIKLYKLKYPEANKKDIAKLGNLVVKLFRLSSIEIEKDKNIIEQNKDLAESMSQLVNTFEDMIKNNSLINKEECLSILKSTVGNLGTKYKSIIVDELPKEPESESNW